jgi:50S ribosomal subunit-associated GTPase HflX
VSVSSIGSGMEETDEKVVKKSMKFVKTSRNIKAGLIGLTNVGKTSVFNLLTDSHGPVDESCFCTIGMFLNSSI